MSRKERRKAAAAARQMNSVSQTTEMPKTQPSPAEPEPSAPAAESEDLRQTYYAKFQPADAVERHLVDEMINAQSRLKVLTRIENHAFAQIESAHPNQITAAFEAQTKLLASLDRVRKSYDSQFSRALANLNKMRAAAKPAKQTPQSQAVALDQSNPAARPQEFSTSAPPLVSHPEPDVSQIGQSEGVLAFNELLNGTSACDQPRISDNPARPRDSLLDA